MVGACSTRLGLVPQGWGLSGQVRALVFFKTHQLVGKHLVAGLEPRHPICWSTFGQVWGPGLALRGPKGSVIKANHAMKQENAVVMKAYLGQIFFFILLFTLIFEIGDRTANYHWPAMVGGCIIFSAGIYTLLRLRAMKLRLSYDKSVTEGLQKHWDNSEPSDHAEPRSSKRTNTTTFQ